MGSRLPHPQVPRVRRQSACCAGGAERAFLSSLGRIDSIERRIRARCVRSRWPHLSIPAGYCQQSILPIATGIPFSAGDAVYVDTLTVYVAEMFLTAPAGLAASSSWAINRLITVIVFRSSCCLCLCRRAPFQGRHREGNQSALQHVKFP